MFDLISGGPRHPFHDATVAPTVVSIIGHGAVVLAMVGASIFATSAELPDIPDMMAFVAAAPAPPAPPPPPLARRAAPAKPQPIPAANRSAAPIEAPSAIVAETLMPTDEDAEGVEGGIAGGVLGGVVGGLLATPASPPPPAVPAASPRAPVRIGGQIESPTLLHRVNPQYPDVAVHARITGVVILEATVDTEGKVESVRVLRSVSLLDKAAIEAVKQWRYSPLVLNGMPTPFILTVTLSFSLKGVSGRGPSGTP